MLSERQLGAPTASTLGSPRLPLRPGAPPAGLLCPSPGCPTKDSSWGSLRESDGRLVRFVEKQPEGGVDVIFPLPPPQGFPTTPPVCALCRHRLCAALAELLQQAPRGAPQ